MGKSAKVLPVHERFHSWQGEGVHLGRSAFFIRLFGCPIHCEWCDSAGTWHPDFVPKDIERIEVERLADQAKTSGAEIVIVTGGEPTIHDLSELTAALASRGLARHLETCGAFPIRGEFDWITLSPKWQQLPLEENLAKASELKIIVEDGRTIEKWIREIGPERLGNRPVWLHPEWSKRMDAGVLESITNWVKQHGAPFRAGFQAHKLYNADLLDPNSRVAVPLGGNEIKGY